MLATIADQCELALFRPLPHQFRESADPPGEPGFHEARDRLSRYWARLGAKPIGDGKWLTLDLRYVHGIAPQDA